MTNQTPSETERVTQVYDERKQLDLYNTIYAPFSSYSAYHLGRLDAMMGAALQKYSKHPLRELRILDVGCGGGSYLLKFLSQGARSDNLYGIDIISERIAFARSQHPDIHFHEGSAEAIPYENSTFDLVFQITVFSSITDPTIQRAISAEMTRVLKPGGLLFWYDGRRQSKDPNLTTYSKSDVQALFPELNMLESHYARLRFGLSRRLTHRSWELVRLLERIPMLCDVLFAVFQHPD